MRFSFFGKLKSSFLCLLASVLVFSFLLNIFALSPAPVYADPEPSSPEASETEGGTESSETSESSSTSSEDASSTDNVASCSAASGGLGWVLCPVINIIAKFINFAYESIIQPALAIRVELLNTQGGTYAAWSTFRNIANIFFVIFMLVVIFSQLTGVGIDNYGIKKSLPKLVAAAILVNLSFFICQLAVDVSNIVGSSLATFLDSINTDAINGVAIEGLDESLLSKFGTTAVQVGVVGGIAALAAMANFWALPGLASAFLGFGMIMVGAGASLLFMFFLLSLRQALVVILVALSPLAFVCYMLPNTKKIFDRWLDIGKGMLLLFPICSLAIGGGRLAARIIMSASGSAGGAGLFTVLTAMIAEVAPFFFVPTLTRSAYKATGALGATLNGISRGFSRGAQRTAARSRTVQQTQARLARSQAERNVESYRRGVAMRDSQRPGIRGALTRGAGRLLSRNVAQELAAEGNKAETAAQQAERERANWTNDDFVNQQREAGRVADEVKKVQSANYGDAEFTNAVIQKATINSEIERDNTKLFNDGVYVRGKLNSADIARDRDVKVTELLARDDYSNNRKAQNTAAVSAETTKMYADRYGNMSINDLSVELANIASSTAPEYSANRAQQFSAVVSTLLGKGQNEVVLTGLKGNARSLFNILNAPQDATPDEQAQIDATRNSFIQTLGASGNVVLKEWSKNLANDDASRRKSFDDFVSSDGPDTFASARNSKGSDAFTGLDKDDLAFLSSTMSQSALGSISDKAFSHAFANASGESVNALNSIAAKLDNAKRESIINQTTTNQFVNTNDTIRRTLATGKDLKVAYGNVSLALSKPENATLAAKLTAQEQLDYGITSSAQANNNTSQNSRNSRRTGPFE
ncbi:hypothetical protein IKG02_02290 [Candidatus Saccharibacteria bacterium]|nr:hypothetical protein [Candidatus Saccharibacteria bacterium]